MSAVTSTARPARRVDQATSAYAYNGRQYLGAIHQKGDHFEAVTAKGANLGRFNTQRAAWSALAEKQGAK